MGGRTGSWWASIASQSASRSLSFSSVATGLERRNLDVLVGALGLEDADDRLARAVELRATVEIHDVVEVSRPGALPKCTELLREHLDECVAINAPIVGERVFV
jgi:hypothetical protein